MAKTVEEYAKLYNKSIRTIKRYKAQGLPLEDEGTMQQVIALKRSRLGASKLFAKAPVATAQKPQQEAVEYVNVPQMFAELDKATRDIIGVYFACVHLGWDDAALRARLKPIFDIVRPYIEEPED